MIKDSNVSVVDGTPRNIFLSFVNKSSEFLLLVQRLFCNAEGYEMSSHIRPSGPYPTR